jgi:osmotically-inducible protein OsmY
MTRNQLLSGIAAVFLLTATALVQADEAGDQQITQQVKEKIATNQPQIARRIEVTTHDGVVTLRGTTMTPLAMLGALHDAGSVQGVTKVDNHLSVQ